ELIAAYKIARRRTRLLALDPSVIAMCAARESRFERELSESAVLQMKSQPVSLRGYPVLLRSAKPIAIRSERAFLLGKWWRGTESNCRHYDFQVTLLVFAGGPFEC